MSIKFIIENEIFLKAKVDHLLKTATAENYGLKERWESPECKGRFISENGFLQ